MSLRVLEPGWHSLVVDFGRPGYRNLGVPLSGAADRTALILGNALVGNPPNVAALEISLVGPTLVSSSELACVVYGSPFELTRDGEPLRAGTTFTLHPSEQLRIGGTRQGMRAYLCVRGGLQTASLLNSQTALKPIEKETEIPCRSGRIGRRFLCPEFVWNREPKVLRVLAGPQADWFRAEEFYPGSFRVTPASNRMGLRLYGEPLTLPGRELVSEPVCPGSVQVTRDGQCIVLGVEGQTIGGYPKIAQVISADLDKLGQLRPDEEIRFKQVSLPEATRILHQKHTEVNAWVTRLGANLND